MKSYTSKAQGLRQFIREARCLVRMHSHDPTAEAMVLIARLRGVEQLIRESYGVELRGLRMLDVGAGQRLLQMKFFSVNNDVVGIDRDVIVQGLDLPGYVRMLTSNGLVRTLKTVGRKAIGVDRRQTRALMKIMRTKSLPRLRVLQMDGADMIFASDSFDVVYSSAVFQHLEDPRAVVSEMRRVLRPRGIAYLDFILYTSRTGAHDLRLLGGGTADVPLWAHLRPRYAHLVQQSAYLNRLRLDEWRSIFEDLMPGSDLVLVAPDKKWLEWEAQRLHDEGELRDYTLEELLTTRVVLTWRKPHDDGYRNTSDQTKRTARSPSRQI